MPSKRSAKVRAASEASFFGGTHGDRRGRGEQRRLGARRGHHDGLRERRQRRRVRRLFLFRGRFSGLPLLPLVGCGFFRLRPVLPAAPVFPAAPVAPPPAAVRAATPRTASRAVPVAAGGAVCCGRSCVVHRARITPFLRGRLTRSAGKIGSESGGDSANLNPGCRIQENRRGGGRRLSPGRRGNRHQNRAAGDIGNRAPRPHHGRETDGLSISPRAGPMTGPARDPGHLAARLAVFGEESGDVCEACVIRHV